MASAELKSEPVELTNTDLSKSSENTEDNVNLQDYVVIPNQISPPRSSSDSHENEDLECYTDAQLKVLLDEAITYKAPEMQVSKDSIAKEVAENPKDFEEAQLSRKARKKLKKQQSEQQPVEGTKSKEPLKKVWPNNYPETEKYHEWLKKQDLNTLPSYFPRTFTWQEYNTYLKENPEGYDFPGVRLRNLVSKYNTEKSKPSTPPPAPGVGSEPVKKYKREKKATFLYSHEVDGYRGCENIASLVKFIENSGNAEKVKKSGKGKTTKDLANKKTKKTNMPSQKEIKQSQVKTMTTEKPIKSIENAPEMPAPVILKQSSIAENSRDNNAFSGSFSPTNESAEFRLVTKKKKKKKPKN